mmetsp:Transcript_32679/g.66705  ORF Transcript_32679/g.66705 Transcript_32679/m.66705 type:complete len:450 (+) Transcript_32679:634-1983(+)
MKCVCVQYLEALRNLTSPKISSSSGMSSEGRGGEGASGGWRPLRSVHLTFVPDEEIGGAEGMGKLLEAPEFEALKPVALALDEGIANPKQGSFTVFYGERTPWWLLVRAAGPTGHGSRFIQNTAVSKLMGVVQKALAFRQEQEDALGWNNNTTKNQHPEGCKHAQARKLGDVTTLNVTMLRTGVSCDGGKTFSLNVIPTEAEAGFDVRICPSLATSDFKLMLDEWCAEEGLSWSFAPWTNPLHAHLLTDVDRLSNPFWALFEDALSALPAAPYSMPNDAHPVTADKPDAVTADKGDDTFTDKGDDVGGGNGGGKRVNTAPTSSAVQTMGVEREIFPAATDSRFLRALGIQAVGFSPMANTPTLLHEHDEALSVRTFLAGIKAYEALIPALADAPADTEAKAEPRCHPVSAAGVAAFVAADTAAATAAAVKEEEGSKKVDEVPVSKRAKA